jgi:hypothetical protein
MKTISQHATIVAMVVSMALVLTTIIILSMDGIKADGPILIGLVGAVSLLAGGIVGNKAPTQPLSAAPGGTVQQETRTTMQTPAEEVK